MHNKSVDLLILLGWSAILFDLMMFIPNIATRHCLSWTRGANRNLRGEMRSWWVSCCLGGPLRLEALGGLFLPLLHAGAAMWEMQLAEKQFQSRSKLRHLCLYGDAMKVPTSFISWQSALKDLSTFIPLTTDAFNAKPLWGAYVVAQGSWSSLLAGGFLVPWLGASHCGECSVELAITFVSICEKLGQQRCKMWILPGRPLPTTPQI